MPKLTKSGALPASVTFKDNGDGTATIAGTAAAGAAGAHALTITAKNAAASTGQMFTLIIDGPPTLKRNASTTATVGVAASIPLSAKGTPAPFFTVDGLPTGLSLTDNGDGTGVISGTPVAGTGGVYTITVTATNYVGAGSDTASFKLTVNEGPTFTSSTSATAGVGYAFSFTAAASGYPAPKITESGTLPGGITYSAATRTLSGTAKANTAGPYPITFTATNSAGTTTQHFTLTVGTSRPGPAPQPSARPMP